VIRDLTDKLHDIVQDELDLLKGAEKETVMDHFYQMFSDQKFCVQFATSFDRIPDITLDSVDWYQDNWTIQLTCRHIGGMTTMRIWTR